MTSRNYTYVAYRHRDSYQAFANNTRVRIQLFHVVKYYRLDKTSWSCIIVAYIGLLALQQSSDFETYFTHTNTSASPAHPQRKHHTPIGSYKKTIETDTS